MIPEQRIGNDINVAWTILRKGEPFNLEGLNTKLYLKDMYGRKAVSDFSVEGNVVLWRFKGADQKHTGKYSLELVINEGDLSMITTDSCNFVNLVFCDCKGELVEDIAISSELGFVAIIVDSELNETSENAVANKAVVAGLAKKANIEDVSADLQTLIADISKLLDLKVDKTSFTAAIKELAQSIATKLDKATYDKFVADIEIALALKLDKSVHERFVEDNNRSLAQKLDKSVHEAYVSKTDKAISQKVDKTTYDAAMVSVTANLSALAKSIKDLTLLVGEIDDKVNALINQEPSNLVGYAVVGKAIIGASDYSSKVGKAKVGKSKVANN